jgi:2-polyprenyl-6-hydroxyphenyl methylase / 3-demethylubiquinone-9 3-methyltransferase
MTDPGASAADGTQPRDATADATLGRVQGYYDRLAPRLYAVESQNWHLQSRMSLVLDTIDAFATPGRALDVGCGTGFLLERLAGRGFSGVGVDLSPESVAIAGRRLGEIGASDRLSAEVGSAYEPPQGPFDLVTLTDVLEHLEDPRACLAAIRSRMAPDGLLVISTPNRRSLPGARRWVAERVPQARIRLSLAPVDNWQTWSDLEGHAAAAGLVPVSRRGIFFRPGGRIGSQVGRVYRYGAARRAETALSRTPAGRFGFYICLGFRPVPGAG